MTIEPVPSAPEPARPPAASPPATRSPEPAASPRLERSLRRVVRRQLSRQTRRPAGTPALTISGVQSGRSQLLRHAHHSPADAILGFELPPEFESIVAVAASVMSAGPSRHQDAMLAVAVSRAGTEVCFLESGADVTETFRPQGWLIDACRRAVGLATRQEPAHPLDLPLALWLDRIMVEVLQTQSTLTWAAAITLCPIPTQWMSDQPDHLGATLASITPAWTSARMGAIAGNPLPVPMRPEHAAWMDDAMFARWCLGYFPDLAELRSDIEFLAPPSVASRVDAAVRAAYSVFAESGPNA